MRNFLFMFAALVIGCACPLDESACVEYVPEGQPEQPEQPAPVVPDPALVDCGNGRWDIAEDGEGCDDGNRVSGDGCDANCQPEPMCGNGEIEAAEECDDGEDNHDLAWCESDCTVHCPPLWESCNLQPDDDFEQCRAGAACHREVELFLANQEEEQCLTNMTHSPIQCRNNGTISRTHAEDRWYRNRDWCTDHCIRRPAR